jgi:hypothetical protein
MNRIICCTALVALLTGERIEAAVSISFANHDVGASDSQLFNSGYTLSTLVPESTLISASAGGASASTFLTRTQSVFNANFDHSRTSAIWTIAYSEGYDEFSVSATTPYVLSGTYAMSGQGIIQFEVYLYDVTSSMILFDNYQASTSTPNQAFALGSTGGDLSNFLQGSLTGTLLVGHTYEWFYSARINSNATEYPAASATGNATLSFGAEVPEPASLIIWSLLGGLGIGIGWWRRKAA